MMSREKSGKLMCRWMFAVAAFVLLGTSPGETLGQMPGDIVRWAASGPTTVKAGGRITVDLNAEIEAGWHIYSFSQPPGGPVASVISFPAKQSFRGDGAFQAPRPNKSFDRNFNMETETYEEKISFKIPVFVEPNTSSGDQKIAIDVLFQACSETICLPPYTSHLFIPIKIFPASVDSSGTGLAETNTSKDKSAERETGDNGHDRTLTTKAANGLDAETQVLDFKFVDFDGKKRAFSEFRGKYVLIDFWATWCAPCLADIPKLKELYDKYKASGFEILGMDAETLTGDEEDGPVDADFVKTQHERAKQIVYTRGAIWTQADSTSTMPVAKGIFNVKALPAKILIDRDGRVIARIGEKDDLKGIVERLLSEKR